jgi:hypothetical protein
MMLDYIGSNKDSYNFDYFIIKYYYTKFLSNNNAIGS